MYTYRSHTIKINVINPPSLVTLGWCDINSCQPFSGAFFQSILVEIPLDLELKLTAAKLPHYYYETSVTFSFIINYMGLNTHSHADMAWLMYYKQEQNNYYNTLKVSLGVFYLKDKIVLATSIRTNIN